MKLDPELLKQIIFASSIGLLLFTIGLSVSLRKYKRRLLKLRKTERKLNCLKAEASKSISVEEIVKIKIKLEELSQTGTYDKDLSLKHSKIVNYLMGRHDCIVKQNEKTNEL